MSLTEVGISELGSVFAAMSDSVMGHPSQIYLACEPNHKLLDSQASLL